MNLHVWIAWTVPTSYFQRAQPQIVCSIPCLTRQPVQRTFRLDPSLLAVNNLHMTKHYFRIPMILDYFLVVLFSVAQFPNSFTLYSCMCIPRHMYL
jgi:hypothetical protein